MVIQRRVFSHLHLLPFYCSGKPHCNILIKIKKLSFKIQFFLKEQIIKNCFKTSLMPVNYSEMFTNSNMLHLFKSFLLMFGCTQTNTYTELGVKYFMKFIWRHRTSPLVSMTKKIEKNLEYVWSH